MIGETIYEGKGKIFVNRMLEGGDGTVPPKLELTFVGSGIVNDIIVNELWTITAVVNDDGSAFADGQGLLSTKEKNNRDIVVATAKGLGKASKDEELNTSQFVVFYTAKNPKARGSLNCLDKKVGMCKITANEETMEYTNNVREWKLR